jgi:hypothetical protein
VGDEHQRRMLVICDILYSITDNLSNFWFSATSVALAKNRKITDKLCTVRYSMHNEFKDDVTSQIKAAHIKAQGCFCMLNSTVQIEILAAHN